MPLEPSDQLNSLNFELLKKVPFLSELGPNDFLSICEICEIKSYEASSSIFMASESAEGLYILLSGRVELFLYRKSFHEKKVLRKLIAGEYFGEIGLLDGQSRSASANVLTKSELLFLPKDGFDFLVKNNHQIAKSITEHLIKIVLNLPKFQIENNKIKHLLENNLLEPNLESMVTLCWAIRENNKNIYISWFPLEWTRLNPVFLVGCAYFKDAVISD